MAILTNSGRAAVAKILSEIPIHLAWGRGDPVWDTTPLPEDVAATALVAEVGRRQATQVMFCTPDAAGDIIVPNGQFSISADPTKYLYTRFLYDYADAVGENIRELAIYINSTMIAGLPAGQRYFLPSDVLTQGDMFVLEHIPALLRQPVVRQQFEYVVQL